MAKPIRAKRKIEKESRAYLGSYNARSKDINEKGWERSVIEKSPMAISVISLALALLFISSNLTGNVVSNLTLSSSNTIAGVFFLLGIIAAFFYLRIK